HTSSFPDGTYGGQHGGFILESDGKCVYIAGDTALTMDMKIIPMQYELDLAILPVGDNFTMGIDDAVIASDWVECDKILGYHYDTFPYIEIDTADAVKKFEAKGKELILLEIGASMEV
ncbi:MAG: MBL fold metallo-hydrolase, partial [Cyclobacteriaceae bacterium]